MTIHTDNPASAEAKQNLSRMTGMVDEKGSAVIPGNNKPQDLLIELNNAQEEQVADDEDVMSISKRLIAKNRKAYEALGR